MKKLNNKKGFTLAELLIVVAIIAVLVAISIPIFSAQLEKAREATDLANIRSAYAECSAAVLTETDDGVNGVTYTEGSGTTPAQATKTVKLRQTVSGWQTTAELGGQAITFSPAGTGSETVTVTVKADGTWTLS